MSGERQRAIELANKILDRPSGDPDDDLAVLSRQLLRALERGPWTGFYVNAQSRAQAMYWLLRAYHSGHREGWEEGPSTNETMDGLHVFLCGEGLDPGGKAAKKLLERTDALR